jgi:hypothetical protein
MEFTIAEVIDHLDGWGLVVDDEDLIAEGLAEIGLTPDNKVKRGN